MSLKIRRILFIFFILAFLVITPIVLGYASGYKFSLNRKIIQKTGMLILNTSPKGANIYVNNKLYKPFFDRLLNKEGGHITTPAKIKGLLPDKYDIKLEKDGYWPWHKKIEVPAGSSIYFEDIYLFKNNFALLMSKGNIEQTIISPDKKYLAISGPRAGFINLTTEERIDLDQEEPVSELISWSADGRKALIGHKIINIDNFKIHTELHEFLDPEISEIKWSVSDNNLIYYKNKNTVNSFDLEKKTSEVLAMSQSAPWQTNSRAELGGTIGDFLVKNNTIFLIEQTKKSSRLSIIETGSNKLLRIINLPSYSNYRFINPAGKLLNIYDKEHAILYLIDPLPSAYFPIKKTVSNVLYTRWIDDDRLLYANDFEIWMLDFGQNTENLIRRISEPIKDVLWHPTGQIIYSTEDKITLLEMALQEKGNIIELINMPGISTMHLNKEGDILYFKAKIGDQEELYKLSLQ